MVREEEGSDNEGLDELEWRLRNRAVAERVASSLARPSTIRGFQMAHASRDKSAVSSCPTGYRFAKFSSDLNAEWCGPFSVARQLIEARAEAREAKKVEMEEKKKEEGKREHPLDAIIEEMKQENLAKIHPSMKWKSRLLPNPKLQNGDKSKEEKTQLPANSNYYVRRKKRKLVQEEKQIRLHGRVPSLFDLCVRFLVDNIDYVESLGFMVDDSIRRAICETLVARSGASKLNGAVLDTISDVGMEVLDLIDCTQITHEHMAELLSQLVPAGLKAILLKHCGCCFGNRTVQSIVQSSPSISIFAISLSGAYLLNDIDAAKLLQTCSQTLSSIQLSECPLLGTNFCNSIAQNFSSSSFGNLLELSLEDIPLSKENFLSLVQTNENLTMGQPVNDSLRNLKSLSLNQIESLDDSVLSKLLEATTIAGGEHLESLCLQNITSLTDQSLESIRRFCCQNLKVFTLEGLKFLTNIGLETFFTPNLQGLPNPPMLKKIALSKLSKDVVTDKVLELAIEASTIQRDVLNYNNDHGKNSEDTSHVEENRRSDKKNAISTTGGLVDINIHQSDITDRSLEKIAAMCSSSLMELDVSFCCQISNQGLGYLVDNVDDQLRKISVWGCAQITDEFVDGHSRVGEIEVEGAWMKKTELPFCQF